MNLELIFNGSLIPSEISESIGFKNGQFLVFHTPNLAENEGIEIGFALTVYVPLSIVSTINKDVTLPSFEFIRTLSSFSVIEIPREYSESNYLLQCGFNSSIPVDSFQVYVVTSSVTQESLNQQIVNLQSQVTSLQNQVTVISNNIIDLKGNVAILQAEVTTIAESLATIAGLVNTLIGLVAV
jgi:hypothetical protein